MNLIILLSIIYLIYFGSIYYHFIIIFAISLILYKFKEAIQNFNKFLGIVFRNFFLSKIESLYQKGKYKTIAAFSEKN